MLPIFDIFGCVAARMKIVIALFLGLASHSMCFSQEYPEYDRERSEVRTDRQVKSWKDVPVRKLNIIKTNFIPLLISQNPLTSELRVVYERIVGENQSTFVGLSYIYPNVFFKDTLQYYRNISGEDIRMHGFRAQIGYKFYVLKSKQAPNGLYVGPHASFNQSKVFIKDYYPDQYFVKIIYSNVNAHVGYQVVAGGFAIDFTTGFGYRHNYVIEGDINPVRERRETLHKGLKFSLFFNMGVAF